MKILFLGSDNTHLWQEAVKTHEMTFVNVFDQPESELDFVKDHCKIYKDLDTALKEQRPSLAVINVPNYKKNNFDLELRLINEKINILVFKFRPKNYEDFQGLLQAAKQNDVNIFVGEYYRLDPLVLRAKEIIQSGEIGKPVAVHWSCFLKGGVCPWEKSYKNLAIEDLGIHHLSAIQQLVGLDVKTVFARSLSPIKEVSGSNSTAILETKGCVITHSIFWHTGTENTSYLGNFVIDGTLGGISCVNGKLRVSKYGCEEVFEIPVKSGENTVIQQMLEAVESDGDFYTLGQYIQVVRAVRAELESNKSGKAVTLEG